MVKLFIPKGPTDKEFIKLVSDEQKRLGRSLPIYSLSVLNLLKQKGKMSANEIIDELKIDESRVRITLESLINSGLTETVGSGRGRQYMLSSKYYRQTNTAATYVRQRDIEPIRHNELVMQLAKAKGCVCRADVEELLHINPAQAYRVLKRLANDGELKLVGYGAGAKYLINE